MQGFPHPDFQAIFTQVNQNSDTMSVAGYLWTRVKEL
jgi:hypothetical protein